MGSTVASIGTTSGRGRRLDPVRWGTIFVAAFLLSYSFQFLALWALPAESPWHMGPVEGIRFALMWNDRTVREVTVDEWTRFRESAEGRQVFTLRRARVLLFYGVGDLLLAVILIRLARAGRSPSRVAVACVLAGVIGWVRASSSIASAAQYRELASVSEFCRVQDQWDRARAGLVAACAVLIIGVLCGVVTVEARRGGYLPTETTDADQLTAMMRAKTDEELSRILATTHEYTGAAQEAARRVLEERQRGGTTRK